MKNKRKYLRKNYLNKFLNRLQMFNQISIVNSKIKVNGNSSNKTIIKITLLKIIINRIPMITTHKTTNPWQVLVKGTGTLISKITITRCSSNK